MKIFFTILIILVCFGLFILAITQLVGLVKDIKKNIQKKKDKQKLKDKEGK